MGKKESAERVEEVPKRKGDLGRGGAMAQATGKRAETPTGPSTSATVTKSEIRVTE